MSSSGRGRSRGLVRGKDGQLPSVKEDEGNRQRKNYVHSLGQGRGGTLSGSSSQEEKTSGAAESRTSRYTLGPGKLFPGIHGLPGGGATRPNMVGRGKGRGKARRAVQRPGEVVADSGAAIIPGAVGGNSATISSGRGRSKNSFIYI